VEPRQLAPGREVRHRMRRRGAARAPARPGAEGAALARYLASAAIELGTVRSSAFVAVFPSMSARQFLAILTRAPLGYEITRQKGSHRKLEASGRPALLWSYHDSATVPPGVIRKYLVNVIGMSESDAMALLKGQNRCEP